MPDLGPIIGLVNCERVIGLAAIPLVLQLIAAIIHPAVFKAVSLVTILGIVVIGVLDGLAAGNVQGFHAQIAEMLAVAVVVIIGHLIIRSLFRAMARASHAS